MNIDIILNRLVETYQPEKIFLFGSCARGEMDEDSDLDIMVIVPDQYSNEKKSSRIGYQALRGTGVAVDLLVWTDKAFNERLHLNASLPSTVIREGRLLYES